MTQTTDETVKRLKHLISQYWDLAYSEGKESRSHDTPEGDAQRVLHQINMAIDELKPKTVQPEVIAWWIPTLLTFKDAERTSCPKELQPLIEGTVAHHVEMFTDIEEPVIDKHGVSHYPQPLGIIK